MIAAAFLVLLALDPVTFGPGGRFHLEQSKDGFGMRSHGVIEALGGNRTKFYPLPQSTFEQFARFHVEELRLYGFNRDQYERQEVIGPYQIEGGRIWFGNNYYDGEGDVGVGAFGYFDTTTRRYTLFSPPEVARFEVSAILVETGEVWIALDQFGEDISTSPRGLVRWNRTTHETRKYPLEFVITGIRRDGGSLLLKTRGGHAIFRDGEVHRFLDDGTPIAKFPPPPSHY